MPCGKRVAPRTLLRFNSAAMSVITDPLFYAFAVPAVVFLGLSKGGFSGIGMVSTPLLAHHHVAARSRRDPAADHPRPGRGVGVGLSPRLGPLESEGDDPGLRGRRRHGLAARGLCVRRRDPAGGRADRARLRRLRVFPSHAAGRTAAAARMARRVLGRRCRASPRRSSRSAPRPTTPSCCRSGWRR